MSYDGRHFGPLKPLVLRVDHAKLLDVLTSLPQNHAVLTRAVCFVKSHPANHATCSYISGSGLAYESMMNQKMFIYRLYTCMSFIWFNIKEATIDIYLPASNFHLHVVRANLALYIHLSES